MRVTLIVNLQPIISIELRKYWIVYIITISMHRKFWFSYHNSYIMSIIKYVLYGYTITT